MGIGFYTLDIYTDIKFTLDMYSQSEHNFAESFYSCYEKFKGEFEQTIQTCKLSFDKKACMDHLTFVKKRADGCFQAEDRFENPTEWTFAGVVCTIHICLPTLAAFLVWAVLLIKEKCRGSLSSILAKLPLPSLWTTEPYRVVKLKKKKFCRFFCINHYIYIWVGDIRPKFVGSSLFKASTTLKTGQNCPFWPVLATLACLTPGRPFF